MRISVIIPTYCPESYLNECIDSLVNQTLDEKEYEVLIILNGKKDPFFSDISKQIEIFKNFKLIYSEKSGVSNARNIGLDIAKGDYITFIDDDDYVSPIYLESLLDKASPDTISLSNTFSFKEDQLMFPNNISKVYCRCSSKGKQSFIKSQKYFQGPWMKLIPVGIIGQRRFDCRFKNGEDSLFMFLISDKFTDVDYASQDCVYYRRVRANSATQNESFKHGIKTCFSLINEYNRIWQTNVKGYSFLFYLSRLLATVKSLIIKILKVV